jgi:hypothetical protein
MKTANSSREKLARAFLESVTAALDEMAEKQPARFVQIMTMLLEREQSQELLH